jgi:prevent-host-death family protein
LDLRALLSILSIIDNRRYPIKVTSTEFQQNVGRYQDAAQRTPVAVTKNGRTHTVLVSAAFFEMVMRGRVARPVEDLDDATLQAIAGASVPAEYAGLDEIIKDWTP